MKKIISIAFVAILAGFAISCQKEEAASDKTDAVQYTFNITVNDQVGFDSDASTKSGLPPSYKTEWEYNDKIFLFFKPDDSLLDDTYATLTYNGSSWDGAVTGSANLEEEGTLSAVYVYNLDSSVDPEFSDNKWTIATGNTFYNCETEVIYTVSGDVISASLDLKAPADFVCFSISGTSGDALTCNQVKGWKDVAIGSEMTFSNVTCTGYMTGFDNIGNPSYKDYYGRIVSGETSLNGKACNFSVVKNGQVWEHTATPKTDARSFNIAGWTEAEGKLPGLFTISKGDDDKAGTADDIQVRFSQGNLVATIDASGAPTAWKFAANQYDYLGAGGANMTIGNTGGDVDLFGWSTASTTYGINTSDSDSDYSGDFKDWGTAIDGNGTWRTLSKDEWTYLINKNNDETIRKGKYKYGVTICEKTNCLILAPDDFEGTIAALYDAAAWATAEAAGLVCLPAAGSRYGSSVSCVGDDGTYLSSTASYPVYFNSIDVSPGYYAPRFFGFSVRLITESN